MEKMKIAVLTEEGLLKIHNFEVVEVQEMDDHLSKHYNLDCINWGVIEEVEFEELFEVYISIPKNNFSIEKKQLKFFFDYGKAKEYFKELVGSLKKEVDDLDEETAVCLNDVKDNHSMDFKSLDDIMEMEE